MTPASSLFRFHRFADRAEYNAAHPNAHAPAFDATRAQQNWEDDTIDPSLAPDALINYQRLPRRGEAMTLRSMQINAEHARRVNLPGLGQFPAWVPAPTVARLLEPGQAPQTINMPAYLSTLGQAAQITTEVGGTGFELEAILAVDYQSETRRMWNVIKGDARLNVGLLLADKYSAGETDTQDTAGFHTARGVGAPGSWDLSTPQPKWIPARIDLGKLSNNLPEVDIPVRDLPPGTTLVHMGLEWTLFLQTAGEAAPPSGVAVDYTARFDHIDVALNRIGDRLTKAGI